MALNNCTFLLYTHSDYNDILNLTLKRLKKHFDGVDLFICTNNAKYIHDTYSEYNATVYEYDDSLPYTSKLLSALKQIKTEYVLFNHDNNILYKDVHTVVLNGILDTMTAQNMDTVRLSYCGITPPDISDSSLVKVNRGGYYLSVFPAFWRTSSLIALCERFKDVTYRQFEFGETQHYAARLKNYYISSTKDYPPYNSVYYPAFHAIQHGLWCVLMHEQEVLDIAKEYKLNLTLRGTDGTLRDPNYKAPDYSV
jgi:hypothetical protein